MNREKELRKLTWKYFFKDGGKYFIDIFMTFITAIFKILIFLVITILLCKAIYLDMQNNPLDKHTLLLVNVSMVLFFTSFMLLFTYIDFNRIRRLLNTNWEWAEDDALRELNKNRRKNEKKQYRKVKK